MLRLSLLLPALLAAGCYEQPADVEPGPTTGVASTGSPVTSAATTDEATSSDESTGVSADDSSGTTATTEGASTSSGTDDTGVGCVPAVFGDALFDNACFQ